MIFIIRLFLIFLCCVLIVPKDQPTLLWNESYKLSWSDFKAQPNYQTDAVAVTASGITFGFSIRELDSKPVSFTTEVYAHFYPEKSWYKSELVDNHVLGHEQLHYDITELYTRKFRKQISELKISNTIKSDLKLLHKNINRALKKMQNTYDTESDFSRHEDSQFKWKRYVETELNKLSEFKSLD